MSGRVFSFDCGGWKGLNCQVDVSRSACLSDLDECRAVFGCANAERIRRQ